MSSNNFNFIMIGAMYENGGNVTHRLLDGHPEMFVYPFESQIGTRMVVDGLSSMFPIKYRWPVFAEESTPAADFHAIIDEEGKVRSRTPHVSKFRHMPFDMNDDERKARFCEIVEVEGRSTAKNIEAFYRATFDVWHDFNRSGNEKVYVGYSPIITVDGARMLKTFPNMHLLHVVRNPWSAYADTKKRPVPMSLENYVRAWSFNQYHALLFKELYPDNVHVIRTEDTLNDPYSTLGPVCEAVGIDPTAASLKTPTWNGQALEEVYPWGTIRSATPEANVATANELSDEEKALVAQWAGPYLDLLDYTNFLG